MRNRNTRHSQCLRERSEVVGIPRALDVKYLTNVLQRDVEELLPEAPTTRSKGKKRTAPRDNVALQPRRKRFKVVESEAGHLVQDDPAAPDRAAIPVYTHALEIAYTRHTNTDIRVFTVDEAVASQRGWVQEETDLQYLLAKAAEADPSSGMARTIDVGEVDLTLDGAHLCVYLDGSFLLTVPAVDPDFVVNKHDMRSPFSHDPLVSCAVLQDAGRAEITARLRTTLLLSNAPNEEFPFRLVLEISVALVQPTIFAPFSYKTKTAASQVDEAQRRALHYIFYPESLDAEAQSLNVPSLYSAIMPAPPVSAPLFEESFQPADLLPALLPFQRRSVAWLLSREGKSLDANGAVIPITASGQRPLPLFWRAVKVDVSDVWYYNHVTGMLSPTIPEDDHVACGILAEEPGLGKTLECIALILLNPAIGRNPTNKSWNTETRIHVKEIKTTLIVTPPSLAQQWADELRLHAPSLKVLVYEGWSKVPVPINEAELTAARDAKLKKAKKAKRKGKGTSNATADDMDVDEEEEEEDLVDWCNYVNQYDVCITTYPVLQQDLGLARPPPDRPRRTIATYINVERPRSPLVMCEWYRVIMDEVQMVGGGNTEEMVSLIPRLSSFAVSGTPARSKVADLIHVLNFLRIDTIEKTPRIWTRLLKAGYTSELKALFTRYAIRTMKTSVKSELTIPKQTRYLVPIELGKVERHVYDQMLENALLQLGFDARGVAVADNWQVDIGALRSWLRKLRGICTHPQVGQLQNQDKLHKPGVLKSMAEVLEDMRDHNWRSLMDDRKQKVHTLSIIAQLQQRVQSNRNNLQLALETLLKAEDEGKRLVQGIEAAIADHREAGKRLKGQTAHAMQMDDDRPSDPAQSSKGKGKARETSEETDSLDGGDDDDLPKTAAGEEHRIKQRALQHRLRECQIVMHRVHFLMGDVYHSLGESQAESEAAAYATAEELRRILLRSTESAAKKAMEQLVQDATEKGITEDILYIEVPCCKNRGTKSAELAEEADEMIDELLNKQGALLWRWRKHLISLLTCPLTSSDEDADGQEYARSLETQGEAEAYLQAYSALLADRREVITAERTLLAALDVKEKKARRTKASKKAELAAADVDAIMSIANGEIQPEHEILNKELQDERRALLEDFDTSRALRSVMIDLNNVAARIVRDEDPEKIMARDGAQELRVLITNEGKMMEKLQADLAKLRKAFNDRISYFRQLQEISDTVAEVEWEGSADEALVDHRKGQTDLEAKINTARARQRYLEHLARSQGDNTLDEDEGTCILCRCEFSRGYITQCAHVFCEVCMKAWLLRKEGKACPVCRVAIDQDQLRRFVVEQKPEEPVPTRPVNDEPAPKSTRQIRYNNINSAILDNIGTMECHGSYGSKIQTLVSHLLYLEVVEPGAKSIVFSAWADSLHIIEHALAHNGIKSLRIDQTRGKMTAAKRFKADPSLQVLLLHGERENAGLNVTCASRVFLVESVVHHGFEVQAIARIDRMGQTRPTEVYCYYAEDTVERNILDLAVRQGVSLYTKENSAGTLTTAPLTSPEKNSIDAPTKKAQKGDFVFKADDMLAILFPHLFEDIEYLIPSEEKSRASDPACTSILVSRQGALNAIAGPSRLT